MPESGPVCLIHVLFMPKSGLDCLISYPWVRVAESELGRELRGGEHRQREVGHVPRLPHLVLVEGLGFRVWNEG